MFGPGYKNITEDLSNNEETKIRELHLFAGIGGGIYGGQLLGHVCCGGVEIDEFCKKILRQRQADGWMEPFDIYDDITKLNGQNFRNTFDILCGGFPCQAFSSAAHGKNIEEKNLWPEMYRFIIESKAPIVFGENVTLDAIVKAKDDLKSLGYKVEFCRLSCHELGADHNRDRYWLLAVKDKQKFTDVAEHIISLPKLSANCWTKSPIDIVYPAEVPVRAPQIRAIGNAQSPFAAATAFRILVNRHLLGKYHSELVAKKEIDNVFVVQETWIKKNYGEEIGPVHTPTTMGNYHYSSMQKHKSCRNYVKIFGKPNPKDAEYLMGFPIGASSPSPITINNYEQWN